MTAAVNIEGIDVSRYQGVIDWPEVARSGCRFAFCKATDGLSRVDPTFELNWPGIREAGLLRGAYHFGHPGLDPIRQAEFFVRTVGPLSAGDLPLVLDIESDDRKSQPEIARWVSQFVSTITVLSGREPIIYTYTPFWNTHVNLPTLGQLPLWVARYGGREPQMPRGWDRFAFWQYTGEGACAGVRGRVDRNRFNGSEDELRLLAGLPGLPLEPLPRLLRLSSPMLRGPDVRELQNALHHLGKLDSSAVDGIFGPMTERAVRSLQRAHHLPEDGKVGPRTRALISRLLAEKG
ncbi:MAG TPA: GH25 family lysozyme [Pyrinomonadaceae bacterium]|jgi:lysozyme